MPAARMSLFEGLRLKTSNFDVLQSGQKQVRLVLLLLLLLLLLTIIPPPLLLLPLHLQLSLLPLFRGIFLTANADRRAVSFTLPY